ncbi:MAG: hypothetical protein JJU32_11235 [Phormidium sp. BM_Day4_Bin.17]|nr:hypothetical protein [Phormidium sp. BM_Day4_Bin.17]UCJ10562.1 MAG: hypothetical protein JWS08_11925 [Phormidium sp. PBR-2020]
MTVTTVSFLPRFNRPLIPLLSGFVLLAGCGTPLDLGVEPTPLGTLSQERVGNEVTVEGVVGDRAPLLDGGAYLLQDETGNIWVVSEDEVPEAGQSLRVQGTLERREILINQQDYGELYLQEQQRTPQ